MADINPRIPDWFIASAVVVLTIIVVEVATVVLLAVLIYRNWR